MQAVRSRDTTPEQRLRSALHLRGLRFRKDTRPVASLRCKADIVFRSRRVAVFVDGCFWHGCPDHFKAPKTNSKWWQEKIDDNQRRDSRQTAALQKAGWQVCRFWEHELRTERLVHEAASEVHEVILNADAKARTDASRLGDG